MKATGDHVQMIVTYYNIFQKITNQMNQKMPCGTLKRSKNMIYAFLNVFKEYTLKFIFCKYT